jgi:arabinofuranosyltransferase
MIEAAAPASAITRRIGTASSAAVLLFGAFLATVLVRTAWVADGAFVDLRTVANVAAGNGLRWNVDERVQTFTDPLWVLLVSAVTILVHHPYVAVLLTAIALTLCAAAILAWRVAVSTFAALIGLALLTFSRSFIEYGTSGYSTPLTYLLIVMFWSVDFEWHGQPSVTRRLLLIASLLFLTEWTTVVAILPALLEVWRRNRPRPRDLAVAASPLIAWIVFAAWYYGAIVPTPIVAAWHAIGPPLPMIRQGTVYVLDAADAEPLAVVAISVASVGAFRVRELRSLSIGLVLSIAAVVLTGGDVMSGRAFAVPVLLAAIAASRCPWERLGVLFVPAVSAVVALGLVAPESPVLTGPAYHRETEPLTVPWPNMAPAVTAARAAIGDERRNWYAVTGLLTAQRTAPLPDLTAMQRQAEQLATRQKVIVDDRIGLFAYAAGPRLHVVDPDGRTDATLARQVPIGKWRPGPRLRDVRPDYVAALERRLTNCSDCGSENFGGADSSAEGSVANRPRNR